MDSTCFGASSFYTIQIALTSTTSMPSNGDESTLWDFSPVFSLLNSLSSRSQGSPSNFLTAQASTDHERKTHEVNDHQELHSTGLGDFAKLWKYLDIETATEAPRPTVGTFESSTAAARSADRDAYASDGALYYPPSSKSVKWRDEVEEGAELADTQPETPSALGLTKNQRKKKNRKLKKDEQAREIGEGVKSIAREAAVNSGDDFGSSPPAPAKQAGIHKHKHAKTVPTTTASPTTRHKLDQDNVQNISSSPPKRTSSAHPVLLSATPPSPSANPGSVRKPGVSSLAGALRPSQVTPSAPTGSVTSEPQLAALLKANATTSRDLSGGNTGTPARPSAHVTVPSFGSSALAVPRANGTKHNGSHSDTSSARVAVQDFGSPPRTIPRANGTTEQNGSHFIAATPGRRRHEPLALTYKTNADRNWNLLLKLLTHFPADRDTLLSPLQLSINRPQPDGIHVFVDASNIMIGFREQLKRSRGIPVHARVAPVDLHFHGLALLLERRRPVAKREFVGSTPELAAFEEARQVGYRVCILDKVYKARELTERQKRFAARAASSGSGYNASASGSDGTDEGPRAAKWVEQGVDEVLHLKILESVVDMDIPARSANEGSGPIMVLASGDAAEAEYSGGFLEMALRALKKGWRVEVVAWGASVSMGYRRLESKGDWAGRFRIIPLDDYVEELFGTPGAALAAVSTSAMAH